MNAKKQKKDKLPFTVERRGKTYVRRSYVDPKTGKTKFKELELAEKTKDGVEETRVALKKLIENKLIEDASESEFLTVADLIANFLAIKKRTVGPRTYKNYASINSNHITPHLGKINVHELTRDHIQSFIKILDEKGISAKLFESVKFLKSALTHAALAGTISQNPCVHLEMPKKRKKDISVFTAAEARRFVAACKEFDYGLMFEFGLFTGMRPEEYLALRWKDVDLENAKIYVRRAIVYYTDAGAFSFQPLKTPSARRSIDLSEDLTSRLTELKAHIKARQQYLNELPKRKKPKTKYEDFDLVFQTAFGRPVMYSNFLTMFRKVIEKAELKDLGFAPYSLRHSCATLLLSAGENAKVIQERLGHASVTITLETYAHYVPNQQKKASQTIENLLY